MWWTAAQHSTAADLNSTLQRPPTHVVVGLHVGHVGQRQALGDLPRGAPGDWPVLGDLPGEGTEGGRAPEAAE